MAGESDKDKVTDWLQAAFNGLTNVMDDIRHKVVEEPWFHWNGRATTGDIEPHDSIQAQSDDTSS